MANIRTSIEKQRGCGYRKQGGIYLVSSGVSVPCGKLPFECEVCPTCNQGIKPARGFTWVTSELFEDIACKNERVNCLLCPLESGRTEPERMGLIWVGEKFYSLPKHFRNEAEKLGVSRRISAVPKDFKVGETWVLLGHRKAILDYDENEEPVYKAGIFSAFKPERIEYIVRDEDTEEDLEKMEKRGFTLVKVIPEGQYTIEDNEEEI